MKKERTRKQVLADYLRRKTYKGCHGQISSHGCGQFSIQIFADHEDREKWPYATPATPSGWIVADFNA